MSESEPALVPDAAHAEGDAAAAARLGHTGEAGARPRRVQQLPEGLPDADPGMQRGYGRDAGYAAHRRFLSVFCYVIWLKSRPDVT